jgi:hypothetical protein
MKSHTVQYIKKKSHHMVRFYVEILLGVSANITFSQQDEDEGFLTFTSVSDICSHM